MKIKLFTFFLCAASVSTTLAQKSIKEQLPQRSFIESKEMFFDKNYVGSQNMLTVFKHISKDKYLLSDADFMLAASSYFRGEENTMKSLFDFLDKYPETYHRNDIDFYIGSYFFEKQDWSKSLVSFNKVDVDLLKGSDQDDYIFRSAYADLKAGNKTKAYAVFDFLSKNSNKYFMAANYYKAFLDFQQGLTDKSLTTFNRLKDIPEYREEALFFILQGLFAKNELQNAINKGDEYIRLYPNSKNLSEVFRIMGNSYFRINNIEKSIQYYQKYLTFETKPFSEDMYQLGMAYTQVGEYARAIEALQFSASKDNLLGQASYMLLGLDYMKIDDNANALMAFDAASRVKFDPSISEMALYNYAMLVHKTSLSIFDQSITVLQRFLDEYPNSKYVGEINNQLSATLLSTNNYQAALNIINKMRNPSRQIISAKQSILLQIGTQYFIDGNYNQAIGYFDSCIDMGNYDTKSRNEAFFWRGETYYRLNNNRAAANDYLTYISLTNSNAQNYLNALYNLGYSYFNLKQYNEALNRFKQYISQENNKQKLTYADALNRAGDCYLYTRDFTAAETLYSQAANSNNQAAEYADFQRSFVLGLQHNYTAKIAALDIMMKKYPDSQYVDDALYEKGRALVMLNKEQDASIVLNDLLQKYPTSDIAPQAALLLGQTYYNLNNIPRATNTYKYIVQNYKNTEESQMAIQDLENIYRDANDVATYVQYVNSLGNGVVISSSKQDSLTYMAAEKVYLENQHGDAITAMQKYLQSYPNGRFTGDAHFYIGLTAYNNKDYDKALTEFNNTIKSGGSKNINKALSYAGIIQESRDNFDAMYSIYKQLDQRTSDPESNNIAQIGLLRSSLKLNKPNETILLATRLLADKKTSPELQAQALLYRAKAHLSLTDANKAIPDLQKASADTRNVYGAESQFLLAQIYFNNKNYDKAIQEVNGFMKQNTPHTYWMARAIIVLADSYLAKGDKFQAKQYLESLKDNYTGKEKDIESMIVDRLKQLNQ